MSGVKKVLSVLLLCFLLVSCGEEREKTIQELAEAGDVDAQNNLGEMYETGRDFAKAIEWYRKSAEQGDADGQAEMGLMYALGAGVPQDNVKAYMFYNLVAAKGFENIKARRNEIEEKMTQEQIAEGEKLTREWLARKSKEKGQ